MRNPPYVGPSCLFLGSPNPYNPFYIPASISFSIFFSICFSIIVGTPKKVLLVTAGDACQGDAEISKHLLCESTGQASEILRKQLSVI